MKAHTLLALISSYSLLSHTMSGAAEDTPVPPEVQKLAESLVAALKGTDDAALLACWHTPEVLGKARQAAEAAEAAAKGRTLTAEELQDEAEDEVEDSIENNEDTVERAARLRQFLSKHFGVLSALTLLSVDVDLDDKALIDQPTYDDFDLTLKTADGTVFSIDVDDLVKLEGAWKCKGRLDDDISIELPQS
jgi:hypothetical protein